MSKLIIFDTETTGLEEEDRIIQVGALISDLYNKDLDTEIFNDLCKPTNDTPIKIEAMATHGIREEQIKNALSFKKTDFYKKLNEYNNNENYLIAHNLDFDLAMLEKEDFENKLKLIDTLQCAKHLFEIGEEINGYKLPNYKLQTFRYMMFSKNEEDEEAKKYSVEIKAHDAIGDVVILKMFLRELYKKVIQTYSIKNPIEIMDKMVELTKTPIPPEKVIVTFGKYAGKSVKEIYNTDKGWLDWYKSTQNPQNDIVEAIKQMEANKTNDTDINGALNF